MPLVEPFGEIPGSSHVFGLLDTHYYSHIAKLIGKGVPSLQRPKKTMSGY